jgi:rubrerythrin
LFTLTDICNIAIQIELNGAETYRNGAETTKNAKIAKTLSWMAEEEESHAEWFRSIQSAQVLSSEQKEMEAIGRSLLQDIVKNNSFSLNSEQLINTDELAEVISQSIEFEQDTILFYEILLDFLDEEETVKQLKDIIQEERNHVKTLEDMREKNGFVTCAAPS